MTDVSDRLPAMPSIIDWWRLIDAAFPFRSAVIPNTDIERRTRPFLLRFGNEANWNSVSPEPTTLACQVPALCKYGDAVAGALLDSRSAHRLPVSEWRVA